MKNKIKNYGNLSFNFSKLSNKIRIHSSLNNICKQLSNISLTDSKIVNLKCGRKKVNSTNRINSTTNQTHSLIYSSKSCKSKNTLYKFRHFYNNDSFEIDNNLKIENAVSFSMIKKYSDIDENRIKLKKKNLILKENLKLLLNEVKKYKKHEKNNIPLKEYEKQIEYYMNEIERYQKEIIELKEKYITVIQENEELKRYINSEINKLNNSKIINSICQTDINKSNINKSNINKSNKIKNLKSFKYLNLNLKEYLNNGKKLKLNKCPKITKSRRNINKPIIKSQNYLLIEDKDLRKNSAKNIIKKSNINNNDNSENFNSNIITKINNNLKNNDSNIIKNFKMNYKYNINKITFKKVENKANIKNNINKTLTKNKINQNSLKDISFELNKSVNLSKSFRFNKDNDYKKLENNKIYLNKYNNYIYFNNHTFNEN